jgi:hypothetical protein
MSHVDEGALHAYLDGALEEYPTGEARRIRAHLERCEACAQALARARTLRDEADLLLAMPNVDVSPPPLEELRTLARSAAESERASRRGVPLYRLGWAASVVLALGVGWMLRGGVPEVSAPPVAEAVNPSDVGAAQQEARRLARAQESAGPGVVNATPGVPAGRQERQVAEAVPPAPMPESPAALDVATTEDLVYAELDDAEEAAADLAEMALAAGGAGEPDPPMVPAVTPEPGVGLAADANTAVVAQAPLEAPTEAERDDAPASSDRTALSARSAQVSSALQIEGFTSRERESRRASAADASEPGSLVVPGLEVVSIVWREEGVVPAGVRVLQRLGDGGQLELIHLPAGFDPGSVEAAGAGVGELVVPRDQGWLIMRGPLAEDEFRSMLERMDAPAPQ